MSEQKIGWFDICKLMARRGLDIRLSTVDNITAMKTTQKGQNTAITIGITGNVISQIYDGELIGGLLLCNREQFEAIQKELESQSNG